MMRTDKQQHRRFVRWCVPEEMTAVLVGSGSASQRVFCPLEFKRDVEPRQAQTRGMP